MQAGTRFTALEVAADVGLQPLEEPSRDDDEHCKQMGRRLLGWPLDRTVLALANMES
jgi:hypothetical protein